MDALSWIVSLGAGGLTAGYIALLIFAPPVAAAIEQVLFKIVGAILSTRIDCAAIALGVGLIAGNFYGDWQGSSRELAEWRAAEHATVVHEEDARAQAEKEIPQLPAEDAKETAPAPVARTFRRFPLIHLKCPKVENAPAQKCPATPARRAADPSLRNDPDNRDREGR